MKKVFLLAILFAALVGTAAQARERHDSIVFVVDISGTVSENGQVPVSRDVIRSMNAKFPDYVKDAAIMTFGDLEYPQMEYVLPASDWDREGLDNNIGYIKEGEGSTPLGTAVDGSDEGVTKAEGKTALVIITDGKDNGAPDPVTRVEMLKKKHCDNVCVFTIQHGDDPEAAALLEAMVKAGKCGITTMAADLRASDQNVQDLVDYIFPSDGPPPYVCVDDDEDGVCAENDECPNTLKGAKVDNRGCWVLQNVHFDVDKYDVKPKYFDELDQVVTVLKSNPGVKVRIEGHTDADGSDEYNQTLSDNRANAIYDYFISKGVQRDRLSAKGYGESRPIASNDTDSGKALNRRIELTVLK